MADDLDDYSNAIQDVIAERLRQMHQEGWSEQHDDTHTNGELADAAACYAHPVPYGVAPQHSGPPPLWPWHRKWWKPKDRRRNLVRAAALIVAEIERLDRNQKPTVAAIEATAAKS